MCLIGRLLFKGVFGRHPLADGMEISESTEKLMGPGFKDLNDSTHKSREIMESLPYDTVHITTRDGLELAGYLFINEQPTNKTAICIHGYNSNGFVDFATVGLEYIRRGFNLLLPTNRACGESGGEWTTFGVLESDDTLLFVDKVSELFPGGETVLHGCSLGGATVSMTSDRVGDSVRAIISDCSYASMRDEFTHMLKLMANLPAWPAVNMLERQFKKHIGCGFDDNSPLKSVKNARVPMFFVHGREDRYIPCIASEQLYNACPTDKELLFIDGAGHAAAHMRGKEKYYDPIFAFIGRHMELPAPIADSREALRRRTE